MNKIATYLNEHLTGEAISGGRELDVFATDGGVLAKRPEMIIHAANTSDIRKVARFCWQLAEKGHVLGITARGRGTDVTGAAVGAGAIISPVKYMNRVVGIDPKQRLVHVQAGASYRCVNTVLSTHRGMTLPFSSYYDESGTIGGAISSAATGLFSARYGTAGSVVQQLEVVLANGDVLQTGRLTKRELNAKKGLSTMEGEIYRQIDNLITDNADLISSLSGAKVRDTSGYRMITQVKRRDGSFDLTPLFIGSQGSLGVISEVILQAEFLRQNFSVVLAAYDDVAHAQAAADVATAAKAASVELIDGRIIKRAADRGKKREYAPIECYDGALVVAIFDDFAERTRDRSAKRLLKQLGKTGHAVQLTQKTLTLPELTDVRAILSVATQPAGEGEVVPGAFGGMWLPAVQFDGFISDLKNLEHEYHIDMPYYADMTSGYVDLLPVIDLKKVSDRQKMLKLLSELAVILDKHNGSLAGYGGDGSLKALALQKVIGDDEQKLYDAIKKVFDPHNILNPGVKVDVSAKELVLQLNAWCRMAL
jgi:FAD/FMN-containing dehydrogenase